MSYLIRQMGHVVMSVPEPMAAAQDLCDVVGLRITEVDGDSVYLSSNNRHHEITYIKGDGGAVAIGLEAVSAEAVDEVAARVASDGLTILGDTPMGKHYDRAVRFIAPGGSVFEVHTPIARNQDMRYIGGGGPRPKRIEHINAFSPDTPAFGDFCEKTLGMKLSDQTDGGDFRWYRSEDGFHHTIAMGPGEPSLHHYAFDLYSMEDLARIADNLNQKDRALVWGPGRHGAGSNIFTYYADQTGCLVENSVEMAHIDNDATYEPRTWDITDGLEARWVNMWGTPPTPGFLGGGVAFTNHAALAA